MKSVAAQWLAHYRQSALLLLLLVILLLLNMLTLSAGRLCVALSANTDAAFMDFLKIISVGLFYDARVVAYVFFWPFIFGSLCCLARPALWRWYRAVLVVIAVALMFSSAWLSLMNVGFMDLYGYPIRYYPIKHALDQGLMNVAADAVFLYWHYLLFWLMLMIACSSLLVWLWHRFYTCLQAGPADVPDKSDQASLLMRLPDILIVIVIAVCMYVVEHIPGRYYLWDTVLVNVSRSDTLNKLVHDPYSQLVYSCESNSEFEFNRYLGDSTLDQSLRRLFPGRERYDNIDDLLTIKSAHRHPALKKHPEKVFIIITESFCSWAVSERARPLGITPEWQRLKKGAHTWTWALENGHGTIDAVTALVMGVTKLDQEVLSKLGGLKTAPAWVLGDNGCSTGFYSCSFKQWSRLDRILPNNGLTLYRSYADGYAGPEKSHWGLHDHIFYQKALDDIKKDDLKINYLLTTANHPPYNVPVAAHGFTMDKEIKERYQLDTDTVTRLGHMWYSDHCLGQCVDELIAAYPDSLIVITGDHYARYHPFKEIDTLTHYAVPVMFYGPNIFEETGKDHPEIVSHHDIMPTICEICLPEGTAYASWGQSLFSPERNPRSTAFCGEYGVFTDGELVLVEDWFTVSRRILTLPEHTQLRGSDVTHADIPQPRMEQLIRWYGDYMAANWYRIHRGPKVLAGIKALPGDGFNPYDVVDDESTGP